ncbi:MAG: keto-hydroxyglutarate-aldolase/keto-deoxy-phosphogluconate aldolase, partial [Spirochaetaceae bacterium]|nr:keto-hydroxyglutarate-aldolase/keto-deoxy-phosphogluconate aldolase [Spirochaetaceae bacterium]
GARFIVSPGFDPAVVDYCIAQKIPVFPGTTNPSEISAGVARGLTCLKFFPAEQSGGVAMLNALAGPFPGVTFMPTGGVSEANLGSYVRLKNVLACGGTWMVKPELIAAGDWAGITTLTRGAVLALHGFALAHLGLNAPNDRAAQETVNLISLFGFPAMPPYTESIFNGTAFETMKGNGRGTNGHVGIKTWDVERALAYCERHGFKAVTDSASWTGTPEKSPLRLIYLDREINGFAFHLVRA